MDNPEPAVAKATATTNPASNAPSSAAVGAGVSVAAKAAGGVAALESFWEVNDRVESDGRSTGAAHASGESMMAGCASELETKPLVKTCIARILRLRRRDRASTSQMILCTCALAIAQPRMAKYAQP